MAGRGELWRVRACKQAANAGGSGGEQTGGRGEANPRRRRCGGCRRLTFQAHAGIGSQGFRGSKDGWRLKEKLTCETHMSASGGRKKQQGVLVHTEDAYAYRVGLGTKRCRKWQKSCRQRIIIASLVNCNGRSQNFKNYNSMDPINPFTICVSY
jgi:hypothetical protein